MIRTLPNGPDKRTRDYSGSTPPYLSREAAQLLVVRGIEHLLVDLPSIDRAHDEGRLTAHRIFFGLPPGAAELAAAQRAAATVTELAYVPEALADGAYLLELQVPALCGRRRAEPPAAVPAAGGGVSAAADARRGARAAMSATRCAPCAAASPCRPARSGEPLTYLCGHSLGLMPLAARDLIGEELDDWARLAVEGHEHARRPWIPLPREPHGGPRRAHRRARRARSSP